MPIGNSSLIHGSYERERGKEGGRKREKGKGKGEGEGEGGKGCG